MTPKQAVASLGVGLGEPKLRLWMLQAAQDSGGGADGVVVAEIEGHEATQRQLRRAGRKGVTHGLSPKELLWTIQKL